MRQSHLSDAFVCLSRPSVRFPCPSFRSVSCIRQSAIHICVLRLSVRFSCPFLASIRLSCSFIASSIHNDLKQYVRLESKDSQSVSLLGPYSTCMQTTL